MALNKLTLKLQLNYRYRLVHFGYELCVHRVVDVVVQSLRHEQSTVVVLIVLPCKHRKRPEIKPVSVLEHVEIVIPHGDPDNIRDKRPVS